MVCESQKVCRKSCKLGNVQLSRLEERLGSEDHRFYEDYKDPVTAAKQLLSLGKGTGEVTEVLYEAARQYQLYGDDRMGEGSVVNVEYTLRRMVL